MNNAWKRPHCPDAGSSQFPVACPPKRKKPRLSCVRLPVKSFLSTSFDLSLHAFVNGYFLQDLLRYFTQNLLPLLSRSGVYLENVGHDRVMQIINTFLLCEWGRGRVPFLCASMALTALSADCDVACPPQPNPDAVLGDGSGGSGSGQAGFFGEQGGGNVVSSAFAPASVEGGWCGSQSVTVVSHVEGGEEKGEGKDTETQTTETQCCDQSVQTDVVGDTLAGEQSVVDCKDSWVQTEEVLIPDTDHTQPSHSPASDRLQQNSVQPENVSHGGVITQPTETAPGLQPPPHSSSQQTVSNPTQRTGIQTKDKHGLTGTGLQNGSPTHTVGNGFPLVVLEGFGQNHVQDSQDTRVDGERTECGNKPPTGETTLPGKTLSSEDATQHTDYPPQGRTIPLRITSGRGNDQSLSRRESAQIQSTLSSVGNTECHVQMDPGHPNETPSPSNSQGVPQFRVNDPGNAQYGVNVLPGVLAQAIVNSMVLPRNVPYPLNILGGPMPCSPSVNRITVRQCPPGQLMTNQQGVNIPAARNTSAHQDGGLRLQGHTNHRPAAQPGIGQHLGSFDSRRSSTAHTSGNLIQLTGDPCQQTARQVSSNGLNESAHEVSQATSAVPRSSQDSTGCSTAASAAFCPQNSATTMDNVAQRGMNVPVTPCGNPDTGIQFKSSAVETGVQSFSPAVNSGQRPGSDQSGNKSSPSCAQQQMCNGDGSFPSSPGQKPVYNGGSQFSDRSSVLARSSVNQTPGASTDCKEAVPQLSRQRKAAENVNQPRCPVHEASWTPVGMRASRPRDPRLPGATDTSTFGDHREADTRDSKPAVVWKQSPKDGRVFRPTLEQTGYIEALQRLLQEDKDTDSKRSPSSLQPTSTPCDSVHMPPIDKIPLPDEGVKGLLPNSPVQEQSKFPVKQTQEKNNIHHTSKKEPVEDMKQTLQKLFDKVCQSASAQQKTSDTVGHIPSCHDIPLPGNKAQHSPAHSPPCSEKNDKVMTADLQIKSEVPQPSVGHVNSPLTPVSPEQSHVGEQKEPKKEMKQTKRGMLRALVDQIQIYVDQLSGAQANPLKSPSPEKPVCGSGQAQEDANTVVNTLPKEQQVSKAPPLGSSRFAPYDVRMGKRNTERYPPSSTQNSDVHALIKALVMNEIPSLMRSHSSLSAKAIEELCARLIARYSAKALIKKGRMCRSTETHAVMKRSRGTMTYKPQYVNRRTMTNSLQVSDAGTVTNIIGRRERSTLTDNRRLQDASTAAPLPLPCLSHSSQTEGLTAEVGTVTDTPPRPVTAEQGAETDSAERDGPATTMTAPVTTPHATHLTGNQLFTNTPAQLEHKPAEQCQALVPISSGSLSQKDSRGIQGGEDLAETCPPAEGEGTVRITIKVKVGKGSNIRLAS